MWSSPLTPFQKKCGQATSLTRRADAPVCSFTIGFQVSQAEESQPLLSCIGPPDEREWGVCLSECAAERVLPVWSGVQSSEMIGVVKATQEISFSGEADPEKAMQRL